MQAPGKPRIRQHFVPLGLQVFLKIHINSTYLFSRYTHHIICSKKTKSNPTECLVKPLYVIKEEAWKVPYVPKVTQLIGITKLPVALTGRDTSSETSGSQSAVPAAAC